MAPLTFLCNIKCIKDLAINKHKPLILQLSSYLPGISAWSIWAIVIKCLLISSWGTNYFMFSTLRLYIIGWSSLISWHYNSFEGPASYTGIASWCEVLWKKKVTSLQKLQTKPMVSFYRKVIHKKWIEAVGSHLRTAASQQMETSIKKSIFPGPKEVWGRRKNLWRYINKADISNRGLILRSTNNQSNSTDALHLVAGSRQVYGKSWGTVNFIPNFVRIIYTKEIEIHILSMWTCQCM